MHLSRNRAQEIRLFHTDYAAESSIRIIVQIDLIVNETRYLKTAN